MPLKDILLKFRIDPFILHKGPDHIVDLCPVIAVLHIDLVLPDEQQCDALGQIRVAADLVRLSRDADDRHGVPVIADWQVDAAPDALGLIVLPDDHDLPAFGGPVAGLVELAHAGAVRARVDFSRGGNVIDVVVADGFECLHDLDGELHVDHFRHGAGPFFYGFKRVFRGGFAVLLMSPLYYITDDKNHHAKFMKIVLPDISGG